MKSGKRAEDAYKKSTQAPPGVVRSVKFSPLKEAGAPTPKPSPGRDLKAAAQAQPEVEKSLESKVRGAASLKKVAKFLLLLGKDEAAKVLKHLPQEDVEAIVASIQHLPSVERVEAEALLMEFGYLAAKVPELSQGGKKAAEDILERAFGAEKAQRFLEKAVPGERKKPFAFLAEFQPHQLKLLLGGESVLVLSLVLPHVTPKAAAGYIQCLPEGQKFALIHRMAKVERISREVISRVETALREKAKLLAQDSTTEIDGKARLGDILRHLSPSGAETLLSELEDSDPELAHTLRNRLFTHERLLQIRDLDLEVFLRDVVDEDIALFIQALPEDVSDKILRNVSERRRLIIREEVDYHGPVAKIESTAALRDFLTQVREALQNGDLRYNVEVDDDYV